MISFPDKIPLFLLQMLLQSVENNVLTRPPNQTIKRHGQDYMKRYMIGRKMMVPIVDIPGMPIGWAGGLPSEIENIYIHEFVRSDEDDPHNHPWPNVTVLLRGEYYEDVYNTDGTVTEKTLLRTAGDVVYRDSSAVHAIIETSPDCLTLFITGRKETDWGFWKDGLFIPWESYHANSAG